ncbi:hypothetical protein GLUCOINTEAF2_0204004 (plasmid) [Komagataeibacter intermedius AF2]|uniref:Uncharacterized protein n=1 Tax=Komagataeibacter intermedius AF2 TaxID=1458464 RepID=A0A0N1FD94_9PROT|nr:hypothetical protein GLUCOINTEAF2_0204004 [Komagataeibacter intermedius AF2]
MEGGGWLGDALAVPAGELLPHRLYDLELARDHLQRLGDALPQFAQTIAATARTLCRCGDDDPLARQIGTQGLAPPVAPGCCRTDGGIRRIFGRVLGECRLQLFQFEFELGQQAAPPFRRGTETVLAHPRDKMFEMGNLRFGAGRACFCISGPDFGSRRPEFGDLGTRLGSGKCCAQGDDVVRVSRHEGS